MPLGDCLAITFRPYKSIITDKYNQPLLVFNISDTDYPYRIRLIRVKLLI